MTPAANPSGASTSASSTRSVAGRVGWTLLWALLGLSLWRLPSSPSAGLDPSWQLTLAYAALHNLQFGTEIVFTYGPLGYLLGAANIGELFPQHIAWQFASAAAFAAILLGLAGSLGRIRAVFACAFFLLLLAPYLDLVQMAVILLVSATLLRPRLPAWLASLLVACLAVLAIIKFTNLLLIGFNLAVIGAWHANARRWTSTGTILGGFAAAFVVVWLLCGQHPGHIVAFVKNSYAVSSAYAGGMGIYETPGMLALGLTTAAGLVAGYALGLFHGTDRLRLAALALVATAASFINWKHGFTRADGHVLAHFVFSLFMVLAYPALFPEAWTRSRRLLAALLGLSAAAALTGIYLADPGALTRAPAAWIARLTDNARSLSQLPSLPAMGREHYRQMRDANPLPNTKALVGDRSVDVLGHEQAYAIFNGLNFRPRPVFQSYSAYSTDLLRLNVAYYQSAAAPDFVLQKVQPIDSRLPTADDSLVARQLYHHYTQVAEERGFLVWQKNAPDPALDRTKPLSSTAAGFNTAVPVPTADDSPVWVEIDLRPTFLGQLRNLFYKPPLLTLTATDSAGFKQSYRLIADMAGAGFLAAPHLPTNYEVAKFELGAAPERLTQLSVDLPLSDRRYFHSPLRFRFFALAPFPHADAPPDVSVAATTRVFHREPAKVLPTFPVQTMEEGGREVLFAHPACDLVFALDDHGHRVRGGFGFVANAYAPPNRTDGAEFAIVWTIPDGTSTVLWHRLLQPADHAGDRGPQSFEVAVPPGSGRLIFRTTSGPNQDISCDWTYWTDVQFSD